MKKKKNKKVIITKRNLLYILGTLIIIILLIWYFISWKNVKKEEKLMNSYLISSNTLSVEIKDLSETVQVLKESPSEYFVYISYTGDEKVYNFEKKFKNLIDNYNLKDEIYYLNFNNIKNNDEFYNELNETFNTKLINKVPCILYFKNNELKEIIASDNYNTLYNKLETTLKSNGYDKEK